MRWHLEPTEVAQGEQLNMCQCQKVCCVTKINSVDTNPIQRVFVSYRLINGCMLLNWLLLMCRSSSSTLSHLKFEIIALSTSDLGAKTIYGQPYARSGTLNSHLETHFLNLLHWGLLKSLKKTLCWTKIVSHSFYISLKSAMQGETCIEM